MVSSSSTTETWRTQFFFLFIIFFISTILYFVQTVIFHKLMVGQTPVQIKRKPNLPLRFNSDGTFKILQVADMHYANGILSRCKDVLPSEFQYCSDLNTTQFIRRLIQAENPDFIAFTGDNIFGPSTADAAESLVGAFKAAVESKLPWAAILGNHDQESTMTREELMHFISLMDYSVSQINPSTYDSFDNDQGSVGADIDGFGNYNLQVYGALGSHLANTSVLNLYFLDSGDRTIVNGIRTYGWIKDSQLRWLRDISRRLQGNKQGLDPDIMPDVRGAPALTFFHIPIPEVKELWYKKYLGQFQEGVACSFVNSGVLETLASMGDVKAVFLGHDHVNDFCGEMNGIWLCYGGGSGYHAYGKVGWQRRARVILTKLEKGKKEWMGVEKIKTWKRLDDGNLSMIDMKTLIKSPHQNNFRIDEQILWDRRPSS